MTTIALEKTNWFMRMLSPMSSEMKLNIINLLSASMMKKEKRKKVDMSFFNGLSNAWDNGVSTEEEMQAIRNARTSGTTRTIDEL